jgi:hypothetical protein
MFPKNRQTFQSKKLQNIFFLKIKKNHWYECESGGNE